MRALATFGLVLLAASTAFAAPNPKKKAECQTKLEKAHKMGIIRTIDVKGAVPVAIVDGDVWRQIDFPTKTDMAETIVCFILSGSGDSMPVTFRDHRTNKIIGEFDGISLTVK